MEKKPFYLKQCIYFSGLIIWLEFFLLMFVLKVCYFPKENSTSSKRILSHRNDTC